MMNKRALTTRDLAQAGMVAAIYIVLTMLFQPISFGAVQFRIAEALMVMPVVATGAGPGLFVGCLLANLLGGAVWFDVLFGSAATLLAALLTRRFRSIPALSVVFTTVCNGLIVGCVVYFGYVHAPGTPVSVAALLYTMLTVAVGEVVVCSVLGMPMLQILRRLPDNIFID